MKIEPDGKQVMTFGGDGDVQRRRPGQQRHRLRVDAVQRDAEDDGRRARPGATSPPPEDTYQFVNPFVMDPVDANHLLTAGNHVHETTDGAGELGDRL